MPHAGGTNGYITLLVVGGLWLIVAMIITASRTKCRPRFSVMNVGMILAILINHIVQLVGIWSIVHS